MVTGEINNGEWTTVNRRSRKQRATTTSYYFTDIPTGWNETALWKLFAKYGRISDVYLAKKKSKDGKSFGFARFLNITNPPSFEKSLNSITIGTHRLTVNIARYQNGVANKLTTKPIPTHDAVKLPPKQPTTLPAYHRTFSNVVNTIPTHIPPPPIPTHIPPPPTPITIHPCPDLISKLSNSLIGELYSIDTLPNLSSIFDDNGFPDIRTKYLGGLSVLLELETKTPTSMLLKNSSVKSCFKTLNPWNNKFKHEDRLVWLSIEGLPPHAWHEAAFSRIASSWGDIIVPETCNSTSNNLVAGKVCVRTKCMNVILHTMPILVDDSHMCIRVREIFLGAVIVLLLLEHPYECMYECMLIAKSEDW
ncbi:RNA-directed DNA polymerase, eukaryota [Tanacetum coccineum]